jgi:hypothetical protein
VVTVLVLVAVAVEVEVTVAVVVEGTVTVVVVVVVVGTVEVDVDVVLVVVGEVTVTVVVVVVVEVLEDVLDESGEKSAVIVPAPFIVAVVELELPLVKAIEAPPLDQLEKVYPVLAVAVIGSAVPAA